eukprot:scaffold170399_cov28-Tisochrysis_lutea.AAC.3
MSRNILKVAQLCDEISLLGRKRLGNLDVDLDKVGSTHVNVVELGGALALQAQCGARLRARRKRDVDSGAIDRLHLKSGAKDGIHIGDRHLGKEVHPLPAEVGVARHREENIKVTRRPSLRPSVALSTHSQTVSIFNTRRDGNC